MKLKVYTSVQKLMLFCLALIVLFYLVTGITAITGAELAEIAALLVFAIVYLPAFVFLLFRLIRYPHHVVVNETAMRSYNLFGKLLCTVDLTRCVYYAHYDYYDKARRGMIKFEARYCMLSNEIFLYRHEVGKKLPEPSECDTKKVLVIRINKTSEPYHHYEDWVQLDG